MSHVAIEGFNLFIDQHSMKQCRIETETRSYNRSIQEVKSSNNNIKIIFVICDEMIVKNSSTYLQCKF